MPPKHSVERSSTLPHSRVNDPAALKARIKTLEAEVARKPADARPNINAELQAAHLDGQRQGFTDGVNAAAVVLRNGEARLTEAQSAMDALRTLLVAPLPAFRPTDAPPPRAAAPPSGFPAHIDRRGRGVYLATPPPRQQSGPPAEGLAGPEQRILDALAWWRAVGVNQPARVQVATVARYSATSTSFTNPLSALRTKGLLNYPDSGSVALTAAGTGKARAPESSPTTAELQARIFKILDGPRRRILEPLLAAYPAAMSREALARAADYSATSTSFTNPLSGLRSLGLIDYRLGGHVVALPILFVE